MSTIITPKQMIEYMLEALDNAVKDYPEEEREATKARLLDAFSAAMFNGPMEQNKCTVCGLEGVSGVVCYHPRCPTRVTCT